MKWEWNLHISKMENGHFKSEGLQSTPDNELGRQDLR